MEKAHFDERFRGRGAQGSIEGGDITDCAGRPSRHVVSAIELDGHDGNQPKLVIEKVSRVGANT